MDGLLLELKFVSLSLYTLHHHLGWLHLSSKPEQTNIFKQGNIMIKTWKITA